MRRWPIDGSRRTPRDSGPSSSASPRATFPAAMREPTATMPYAFPGRPRLGGFSPIVADSFASSPRPPAAWSGLRVPSRATACRRLGPLAKERRAPATFVLRSFGPDDPASLPRELRLSLEQLIARCTGARPDSERPGREYRLQERADGDTLFLERVAAEEEAAPRRGELPRSTCRLLAELTEPRSDDVFLDPFCGYGGIALERALAGPYRFVFASDLDPEKIAAVKAALSSRLLERRRKTIFPKTRDALDPSAFESGFVTAMATDPPWGLYGDGPGAEEAAELRRAFLVEAARLLAPEGRLVLLTARGNETDPGPWFAERECLEVLVSGKKAKAIRLDRLR